MFWKKWSNRPWYPYAVAGVIIVIVFVILLNIKSLANGFAVFCGYFTPVVVGAVMAYVMNQLSVFYQDKILFRLPNEKSKHITGLVLSVITVIAVVTLALVTLIPQLISSVSTFADNLKIYEASVEKYITGLPFLSPDAVVRIREFLNSSGGLLEYITKYVVDHLNSIIPAVFNTGRGIVSMIISFILAIYFLGAKHIIKTGTRRFLHALFGEKRFGGVMYFLRKCNAIVARFLVYNILDALIVGFANAVFMMIANMPYVGLISFIVGLTNLVPTFGPIVGGAVGALLLVIIKPMYALAFLIFTIALQTCDGYIIKPKLFGSTLGVPGFLVLIAVVVFGRALGVIGILLSIPAVAIIDFIYHEYLLPWMERRHERKKKEPEDKKDSS